MEHGIILLIEAIIALDRRLQKPLTAVVPELPRLRAAPREYLAEEPLVIGPRRPYAVAGVLGMLVSLAVFVVFVIAALDRPRNQPIAPIYVAGAGLAILVSGAATTALLLHWLRGGSAVLRPQGVEFVYRGRSIFCPWTLFQAPGAPYQPDHKRVILPANDVVVLAERRGDDDYGAKRAQEIKSPPVTACADSQIALSDLYEVRLADLAQLLLELGPRLGDGDLGTANFAEVPRVPLATAEAGGWLRVRLTRLPFPPMCCRCGNVTREAIALPLDARNNARIELPVCLACQAERTNQRRRALLWGVGLGLAPAILWVLAAGPLLRFGVVCLGVGVLLPMGVVVGAIVGLILRDRADPVRFREYMASAGTVQMRLKPAPGVAAFRRAVGVCDEPDAS
jgi:hypothetical protein